MKKEDVTLLINSCDAYQDILDPFFELLHRYEKELPFEIVLSSESLEYKNEYFNIRNVHPKDKKCSWTRRIYEALEEINTDYVLFLLDDLFITAPINMKEIMKCVNILKKNQKIVSFTYWPIVEGSISSDIDGYRIRKENVKYKIAAIASLWNRKQFIKYVKDKEEDIWEFEVNGTIRSNTLYKEDIFYCTEADNMPIPYDFTRIGLISGKWFKDTIPVFEKEKIKIDFNKRGVFDESLYGLNRSFISSFKIEAYAIPNIREKEYNPIIKQEKTFPIGKFDLSFDITGAKEMVRITLSEQSGFAVKDSEIEVEYLDHKKEMIPIEKIFGNFVKEENQLIFYAGIANIYIPIKKKKAKRITYKGESICPLTEEVLKNTYQKKTESNKLREKQLAYLLDQDRIIEHLGIEEGLRIYPKLNGKEPIKKEDNQKHYHIEFQIKDKKEHKESLVLSKDVYFAIKDLRVFSNENEISIIEGPGKVEGHYLFLKQEEMLLEIPKKTDKIEIEFTLVNPVKKEILSKMFVSGNTDHKIDRIRRRIIWKLKKIIKKFVGKKMEN